MSLERVEQRVSDLRAFSGLLKEVRHIPPHLTGVKAILDYREEEGVVEISFFFRLRFLQVKFINADHFIERPKFRMDFRMSIEDFEAADHNELQEFMTYKVFRLKEEDIYSLSHVMSIKEIYEMETSLAGAVWPVNFGVRA